MNKDFEPKDFETKDFENEYKEYSKLNTPDLWSRIEEGLDKVDSATVSEAAVNEAVVNETVESEVIEGNVIQLSETVNDGNVVRLTKADTDGNTVQLTETDTDGNAVRLTKTVKKKKSITKYAGIIAAAACAVIAIPAIIFISGNKSSHYDSEAASASACEAAEVSYEATADEEAYEASYEEAETSFEAAEESMVNEATADMASEAYYEEEAPAAAEATTEEASAPEKSEFEGTGSAANSVRAEKVAKDENGSSKDDNMKGYNADGVFMDIIPYFEEDFPGTTDSIDFSMAVGDPKTKIILEANCDIKDFKFMKMSVKDVYEDGSISVDTETIIVQKNFNKGELIGIDLTFFGDMPEYAVSYVDDAGVRRFCSLMESGYDGSLVLNEENVK